MGKRRADSGPPGEHPPAPAFRSVLPSASKSQERRKKKATVEVTSVKTDQSGKLRAQSGTVKPSKRAEMSRISDAGPSGSVPQPAGEGVELENVPGGDDEKPKRKSTKSSVKLTEWLPERDTFLDELLRHDGKISDKMLGQCSDCKTPIPPTAAAYRCQDCFDGLQFCCSGCARAMHLNAPFHRLQKWSESHLVRASTRDLGITFQLGHDGGSHCSKTTDKKTLLVIHTAGVFKIYTQYCDCEKNRGKPRYIQLLRSRLFPSSLDRTRTVFTFEVLDMFQELNTQGKTTVYDYYHTLLRQTDFLQLEEQASQLNNLHRAIRLWRHLHALKRAGRGHDPAGPSATSPGELVVECPACPHPGKNLPDDWRNATTLAFLYTIFLAVDANFKLKCKERGFVDYELGSGWGVFVNEYLYQLFLKDHYDEPEINTCDSEHDAVLRAAIRCTPGYAVTGAGLVICSRHCLVRPNGAGDLQRGERYCNMDYIVFSALVGLSLMCIVLTYDIACQWSCKYRSRMEKLLEALHLPDGVAMDVAIPSWHINRHGQSCQDNFHVGYLKGVGRLCGDEVEQTWWGTNPLGTSVREMTPAARHETLNVHWNAHNSQKINLLQAVEMEALQLKNFEEYNTRFENNRELVDEWTANVTVYENDPENNPNPYVEVENTSV
ncbi:hypothetical protein FA13DRAFT_1794138 [Coprinellus micaceus]|uniref:CxC2-like cysteine cluster KDZ transposase-associated domain-containing protein n=1 Tax=Coprinellus micaceus TaxID=71717 RepID=A0A4Y7T3F4_COPMI|nr:hypothetical protein FA13DRAFT_1794138 [Coprinellus micaceus]